MHEVHEELNKNYSKHAEKTKNTHKTHKKIK